MEHCRLKRLHPLWLVVALLVGLMLLVSAVSASEPYVAPLVTPGGIKGYVYMPDVANRARTTCWGR